MRRTFLLLLAALPLPAARAAPLVNAQFSGEIYCSSGLAGLHQKIGWTSGGLQWKPCDGNTSAWLQGTLLPPDEKGSGTVELNWSSHTIGGDFKSGIHLDFRTEIRIGNLGTSRSAQDLAFLWLKVSQRITPPGVAVSTTLQGGGYTDRLDKYPIGEGWLIQASAVPEGVLSVHTHSEQYCSHCDTGAASGRVLLDYRVISPDYCSPQDLAWKGGALAASAEEALGQLVCASRHLPWNDRGSLVYPKVLALERTARKGAEEPVFARIAAIQLDLIWKSADRDVGDTLRSEALSHLRIGKLLSSTTDPGSVMARLLQARYAFKDLNQRLALFRGLLGTTQSAETPEFMNALKETLEEPELMTIDDLDEAILGSLAVGLDLMDEATVAGLEAELYGAKSRP